MLPTDGSEGVAGATEEAVGLAASHGATLHALYVVDTSAAAAVPEAETVTLQEVLESAGHEAVGAVEDRASADGVAVQAVLRHGPVHRRIIEYADEADVDLIVMGTHGRSGLDRLLLGSVTERVVRQADQPVLVTRLGDERRAA